MPAATPAPATPSPCAHPRLQRLRRRIRPAPRGRRPARLALSNRFSRNQPVYYQADTATYDRDLGIVTLTGHVEFWQNDRDAAGRQGDVRPQHRTSPPPRGHVVLLEPDGQTVFSDYAELTGGMKDGVMTGMRALLAQNGRLAANGGAAHRCARSTS